MKNLGSVAAVACAMLLVGCQANVIDGFPIGAEVSDCARRPFTPSCDQLIAAAKTALDARDGGHDTVRSTKLYHEVDPPLPREAGDIVAVFALSDGTRRAILTGWSPGGSLTVDYGP